MHGSIIPLIEIQEIGEPSIVTLWFEIHNYVGEVALCINLEKISTEQLRTSKEILENLTRLVTLGAEVKISDGDMQLNDIVSLLSYISESPHYPFTYITVGFHRGFKEEQRAGVIATIHRMAKKPFSILPYSYFEDKVKCSINLDQNKGTKNLKYFLATALAAFLTAKTRRGYTLLQVLSQSLPLLNVTDKEVFTKVLASIIAYAYALYRKRITGELSETFRHLIPEPPNVEHGFARLYDIFSGKLNHILSEEDNSSNVINLVEKISAEIKDTLALRHEVLFGRIAELRQKLVNIKNIRVIITVATEQWSPMQRRIFEDMLSNEGELLVLYTQASLHSVLLERIISSWIAECDIRRNCTETDIDYILISATDAFITENIGKIIESILQNKLGGCEKSQVLVIAQGPAAISVPLYLWAKRRGYEALII